MNARFLPIPLAACFVFGLALTGGPLGAEEKEAETKGAADPRAHALIDKHIKAMGGEEALKKIKSRVAEGELTMADQGITIEMKISQKAPNKIYVEQSVPGLMEAKQGFDGQQGWAEDTLLGFRVLEGAELEQVKRESNIERELKLKEEYPVMKVLPDQEVNGKKAHVVEATSEDGEKETWYFDAESGLLGKMEQTMNLGPQGEIEVTLILKDYEEIDGIKLPMTSEIKNPAFSATLKFESVKHHVELDDKIFEAPESES